MYISSFISPLNTMFQGDPILTHTTCAESHPCHQGTVAKRPATKAQLSQRAHDMLGFTKDGMYPATNGKYVLYVMWWDGMGCVSVCMHACMYACMCIYIYTYICIYTCYIYTYIHIISIYVYCIWCICINTSIRVCPGPGFRAFGRHCHGRRGWMPRVLPSWRFRTAWPGSIVSWGYHGDIMGISWGYGDRTTQMEKKPWRYD